MKFYIHKIILWLKNGTQRELEFKPNKINVITGNSETGKSSIIKIIDYCLFATSHNISKKYIGENTDWYGINFYINDKYYTIARKASLDGKSSKYYFSDLGFIPSNPDSETFITELNLKLIIEKEFSINKNTKLFGSDSFKKDTKISLRYFLLFNTQRQDVFSNSTTLFDKQIGKKSQRYQDALHQIFDLAIGIKTLNDTILDIEITDLEKDLRKVERKRDKLTKQDDEFLSEKIELISEAKKLQLLPINEDDINRGIEQLKLLTDLSQVKNFVN